MNATHYPQGFGTQLQLFGVRDTEESEEILFIVEAANIDEARLRGDCIAPLYGWKDIAGKHLQEEPLGCPGGTPEFLNAFFDVDGPAGPLLASRKGDIH